MTDREVIEPLLESMSAASGLSVDELRSDTNRRDVTSCRFILFMYIRDSLGWTTSRTGGIFGRDHATVIYGTRRAREFLTLPTHDTERGIYSRFMEIIKDKIYDRDERQKGPEAQAGEVTCRVQEEGDGGHQQSDDASHD